MKTGAFEHWTRRIQLFAAVDTPLVSLADGMPFQSHTWR